MIYELKIAKCDIAKMKGDIKIDEKIESSAEKAFGELNSEGGFSGWTLKDIKEDDTEYIAVMDITEKVAPPECESSCEDCCEAEVECDKSCDEVEASELTEEAQLKPSTSYEGPWHDQTLVLDIAQMAAFFEVVQFMDYMVKRTQMITPVAARSLQECQRIVLNHFTNFDPSQLIDATPEKPAEIKIKDEFAIHLKNWQEESVQIYEKLMAEQAKKPQIVTATMTPKDGFDPKGPIIQ
jgi:hypothetical protein